MRHLYPTVTAMQCATSHFDTVKTRLESVITVLEVNTNPNAPSPILSMYH